MFRQLFFLAILYLCELSQFILSETLICIIIARLKHKCMLMMHVLLSYKHAIYHHYISFPIMWIVLASTLWLERNDYFYIVSPFPLIQDYKLRKLPNKIINSGNKITKLYIEKRKRWFWFTELPIVHPLKRT